MISLRRSDIAFIGSAAVGIVFGVLLNPLVDTWWQQQQAVLGIIAVIVLAAVALEVARSLRVSSPTRELTLSDEALACTSGWASLGALVVLAAWAFLYREWWSAPRLFADDFRYIQQSADWETTKRFLFVPFNEHVVPATRIITWLLVQVGGDRPEIAFAAFSVFMFLATTVLLFLLARRVGGGEIPALAAAAWFAVATCHSEVVTWYSASQWLIAACLLLGSLLLVERRCKTRLFFATLFAGLAPWSYSIGAIVGPFTTFWLFAWHRRCEWRSLLPAVAGIASSIAVVVLVRRSMNDPAYWETGGRGFLEAFSPMSGFLFSVRLFVDRVLPVDLLLPWSFAGTIRAAVIFALVGIVAVTALRMRPPLACLWPTVVLIALGYAITIPFRTWHSYSGVAEWNRYQMIPQIGMALLVAGVVGSSPHCRGRATWRGLLWFLGALGVWTALQSGVVLRLVD